MDQMHEELMEATQDFAAVEEDELESVSEVESNNDDAKSCLSDDQVNYTGFIHNILWVKTLMFEQNYINQLNELLFSDSRQMTLSMRLQILGFRNKAVKMEVVAKEREPCHF